MSMLSAENLKAYAAPLLQPGVRAALAACTGLSRESADLYVDAICNEAQTGLRLLRLAGMNAVNRILEVGAGGGLLTGFLQSCGLNIVAIEPAAHGFEVTPKLAEIVREATGVAANILPLAAREVSAAHHGTFDLIFSINVIEHFQPLNENLDALVPLMNRDAVQIHTCPNYRIPYEPHYGIPLLPFAPRLTPFLGNRRSENLWHSLNFITSRDLRDYAKRSMLTISFQRGALAEAFERLCTEPEFAVRHPKLLHRSARFMKASGLIGVLERLPAQWVTPMTALLQRS